MRGLSVRWVARGLFSTVGISVQPMTVAANTRNPTDLRFAARGLGAPLQIANRPPMAEAAAQNYLRPLLPRPRPHPIASQGARQRRYRVVPRTCCTCGRGVSAVRCDLRDRAQRTRVPTQYRWPRLPVGHPGSLPLRCHPMVAFRTDHRAGQRDAGNQAHASRTRRPGQMSKHPGGLAAFARSPGDIVAPHPCRAVRCCAPCEATNPSTAPWRGHDGPVGKRDSLAWAVPGTVAESGGHC